MNKKQKIVLCIGIAAIGYAVVSVASYCSGFRFKINHAVSRIMSYIFVLFIVLCLIAAIIIEIRNYLKNGKIIYHFSRLYKKSRVISLIICTSILIFDIIIFKHDLESFCLLLALFIAVLTDYISLFSYDGITENAIGWVPWNDVEYIELDKKSRIIKFKDKNSKSPDVRRILDKDWNDGIADFLNGIKTGKNSQMSLKL